MYTFKELQKACRLSPEGKEVRLAVLGNCSTQLFSAAVEGCAKLEGLNLKVLDADYNQIDVQLLDRSSPVYMFRPDYVLLWFAAEKLYEEFLDMEPEQREGFADTFLQKMVHLWEKISAGLRAVVIQPNFTELDDKVMGQYSAKIRRTFIFQIRKLNGLLQEAMTGCGNVYPADFLAVQMNLGRNGFFQAPLYYHAKMPVAISALPYLAQAVTDILLAMTGNAKKCVILDLDNTLWGGVIGDDGLGGIEIGEFGRGHAFTNLQRWLKQLKEYGVILAVCSKNEEQTAKEPFIKHREMILRLPDIAVFAANWKDKASNIRMIQESLNISMDSIVFLDDNAFERELVRTKIPDIEVPELPEDPALWLAFLWQRNYFETVSYTGTNMDRTIRYQEEFQRKRMQDTFENVDDYLESLGMAARVEAFQPVHFARIAQLSQRSNQFNLRTVRYLEDDIRQIAGDSHYVTMCCSLRDKFGDHGLVSAVIMEKRSVEEWFVKTWFMSCRVLKRTMEEFVMNSMVRLARKQGVKKITAEYIPTAKNKMVKDIYKTMGFTETEQDHYVLSVDTYQDGKTFIREDAWNG